VDLVSLLGDVKAAADDLRRQQAAAQEAREKLRAAILAAHAEKVPLARIAEAAGLSRQRIAQIVAGE
jgi:hypothetical protein